ncbi:hypothetical protein D3C81_2088540 [compost metagenome]
MSVSAVTSETTSSSQRASASRTRLPSGRETAGLVPSTQSARISPRATASNSATALWPGPRTMVGLCQKRCTRSHSTSPKPM